MTENQQNNKRIKAVMPSVASFKVNYESEEDLKDKICKKLGIEPEFTNLIFVDVDEDLIPISAEELEDYKDEREELEKPLKIVIVDYIWARQMIALKDKQRLLREAKALVVGAGALGNEIVKNLVWLGFGKVLIVDYDDVEFSNVSRGLFEKEDIGRNKAEVLAEKIGTNSPYAEIEALSARVEECDSEQLKCDVILSALDNMPTRIWLVSFCVKNAIPLIDGGVKEFQGRIQTYIPNGPCLACNIPMDRYAEIMELSNPCEGLEFGAIASFSTVGSIVAGVQANEAMKIIAGLPTLKGVLLMDFLKSNYSIMPLSRNMGCFVCGKDSLKTVSLENEEK
ncbi:MAG: ThiF family adenylyltransferase [Thermoplasmata archaeon]|nr:MAG: ThiF family adenylyltransferase [Thermoplasmata archaeon]